MENRNIALGLHAKEKQARARQLRQEMTPAESRLWQRLRHNRLDGLHFRRQQVIDGFIADFYCHAAGLIIEVDGDVHANQSDYDALRDSLLAARGFHILRIPNIRIEQELETVLTEIQSLAKRRLMTVRE